MGDSRAPAFRATATAAVIHLEGEFDVDGIEAFHQALAGALRAHAPRLVIDLTDVTLLATAGLTALLRATRLHPDLRLRGAGQAVRRMLEVSGVDGQFTFDDD